MNQVSQLPFGPDITQCAGYLFNSNRQLGSFSIIVENTDPANSLVLQAKGQSSLTNSGFSNIGAAVTIVAQGSKTLNFNVQGKKFAFFGSGQSSTGAVKSVTANISVVYHNKGDLRGAQFDLIAAGKKGFGYDLGVNKASIGKAWGAPPDQPGNAESDGYGGVR